MDKKGSQRKPVRKVTFQLRFEDEKKAAIRGDKDDSRKKEQKVQRTRLLPGSKT